MNKSFLSAMIISSMLLAPCLKADDAEFHADIPEAVVSDAAGDEPASDEGTSVGQASSEGSKTAKRKMWQNIGLATGAVAIAVTALILVSDNNGHKSHAH